MRRSYMAESSNSPEDDARNYTILRDEGRLCLRPTRFLRSHSFMTIRSSSSVINRNRQ